MSVCCVHPYLTRTWASFVLCPYMALCTFGFFVLVCFVHEGFRVLNYILKIVISGVLKLNTFNIKPHSLSC